MARGTRRADRQMDRGRQEALARRERRTGQRRHGPLPDHRQGLRRHRAAHRLQDGAEGRQRHLPAGHAAGAESGTTPRKAASGTSAPTRAAAACGTTAPARPARIRSSWPTSRSASGTASASFRSASASPSISTTSWSSITPGWRTSGTASSRSCRQGPIQLQTHGGEIRWRNIFIREIPPAEANAILRKHGAQGFENVFNGKDFTGWAGPVDKYEVKDGAIVCQPKKGGTIYTKGRVRRFRRPRRVSAAAGRQQRPGHPLPRQGRHRLTGMCEVQVLDDTAPEVRQARSAAVQRLGLRHGARCTAATCGRSASGTSRR